MVYNFLKALELSRKMLKYYSKLSFSSRTFATNKILTKNYEGDGKTTVTMLSKEHKKLIMINSFSNMGFRLSSGIFVVGPVAAFPRTVLQWNVNTVEDITPESLSLFCLLEPKLDILFIGTGDTRITPKKDVLEYLKSNKLTVEILSTYQACSVFNFLNAEGRYIAGAFIPPVNMQVYEEEQRILFEVEAIDDYSESKHDPKIYK